jgi:hypothetical protein
VITGLSINYVKDWGVVQALRELLQNAVDVGLASVFWADGYAKIVDNGSGISRECWAMGESHKEAGAIGQFGEGLKLALLVLAREKRQVIIESLDYRLTCSITQTIDYGSASVLSLDFAPSDPIDGTVVQVECSEQELEQARGFFAALTDVLWIQRPYVSIGHTIYVNGCAVASDESLYMSYHFDGDEYRTLLNRDRDTIDWPNIESLFAGFSASLSTATLAAIIGRFDGKESSFNLSASESLLQAWITMYGAKAVMGYSSECDRFAEHSGYEVIHNVPWRWQNALKRSGVLDAKDVINKQSQPTEVKAKNEGKLILTESLRRIKVVWDRTQTEGQAFPTVKVADSIMSGGRDATGLYEPETNTVWVRLDRLGSISDCVSTLLHELGHAIGGKDLTDQFQDSLVKLTIGAMRL